MDRQSQSSTRNSTRRPVLTVAGATVLVSVLAMFGAASAGAQTTTTTDGATTTTAGATTTTAGATTTTAGATTTTDADDGSTPAGGVDTGAGGTATSDDGLRNAAVAGGAILAAGVGAGAVMRRRQLAARTS